MKVIWEAQTETVRFAYINPGECFSVGSRLLMRLKNTFIDEDQRHYNAVDSTGELDFFTGQDIVSPQPHAEWRVCK